MQTHPAKRVAIIIEAPMERRLRTTLEAADVTGFTIVPVIRAVRPMEPRRTSGTRRGNGASDLRRAP